MLCREIITVCSQIHTKHTNTLCGQNVGFLRAFAKLRTATISFVMSVRPEQLDSHWTDYNEILFLSVFFVNLSRKFKFH